MSDDGKRGVEVWKRTRVYNVLGLKLSDSDVVAVLWWVGLAIWMALDHKTVWFIVACVLLVFVGLSADHQNRRMLRQQRGTEDA